MAQRYIVQVKRQKSKEECGTRRRDKNCIVLKISTHSLCLSIAWCLVAWNPCLPQVTGYRPNRLLKEQRKDNRKRIGDHACACGTNRTRKQHLMREQREICERQTVPPSSLNTYPYLSYHIASINSSRYK